MKIFISETVELPTELSYLLAFIAKKIMPHVSIFLPERKLVGTVKQNNILKELNLSEIEIFEDIDVKKSKLELKRNMFKKDTLNLTLGEDFYEMVLNFQNTFSIYKSGVTNTKMMPYDYVLRILKILLRPQLLILLGTRLKHKKTEDGSEHEKNLL